MDDKRRRFEALAMPHLEAAYNLARWLGGQEADDIVQEAMLNAFRSFDGFRGEAVKPWLLQIVRNCHLNAIALKKRHAAQMLEDTEIPSSDPTPEGTALQKDLGRVMNQTIRQLPEEFREVVVLRELEDMSYREIAQVTGAPIGTVMSRLARARALIKKQLEGAGYGV